MWELRRLTTLRASTACYRDSFIVFLLTSLLRNKKKKKADTFCEQKTLRNFLEQFAVEMATLYHNNDVAVQRSFITMTTQRDRAFGRLT
jgi:hypothetical protein